MSGNASLPPERTRSGLPKLGEEDHEATGLHESTSTGVGVEKPGSVAPGKPQAKPFLMVLRGKNVGRLQALEEGSITIGRSSEATMRIDEQGVSRIHAKVSRFGDDFIVEDLGSANGTFVNGKRTTKVTLKDGDRVTVGANTIISFEYQDEIEQSFQQHLFDASTRPGLAVRSLKRPWTSDSWKSKPAEQKVTYDDPAALATVIARLKRMPPLVTSWEIEDLKVLIGEAQQGKRFLLQGGDCAETLDECDPSIITNKLKILMQMSLVLIHGTRRPIVRVGRFAGQYAKPRSRPTETKNGVELPSYLGDLVNHPEFTPEGRRPDPQLLLAAYQHSSMTLNFIRALGGAGFADLRRPEYFDLSFFDRAELPTRLREEYHRMSQQIAEGLHFAKALGDGAIDELTRVAFFTSHEGLNLDYESAQTRAVPRREGHYNLTTHLPWIGERTRALGGAHIEYFRGIANPVGVKLGPTALPQEAVELCRVLNPDNEAGKLVFIIRMGAKHVTAKLPALIYAIRKSEQKVLWVTDPMHGNMIVTKSGLKTRNFEDILREVEDSMEVHASSGTYFGGVHFELTGDDVTECIGGGISEEDLDRKYLTACDPRLNYRQAVEMAFSIARRMSTSPRHPSTAPPPPPR